MMGAITLFGQTTSLLELIAMLTGMAGVWLTVRQNVYCFPIGIINVGLYALLFMTPAVRLYADAMLQCIYLVLLVYGWMEWTKKKSGVKGIRSGILSFGARCNLALLAVGSTAIMGFMFRKYTDASLPFLDSFLTSVSLVAQWMIARKKIENWLLWIFADAIYIPLYIMKQLPLTAFLYFIFLLMAVKGYMDWKKSMAKAIRV